MKAIKGLSLFGGVIILVSACFNPPEFPVEPKITYESIYFGETPNDQSLGDSIVLSINFKDGDGDLGLDGSDPKYSQNPFQPSNLFLAKDGAIVPVALSQHWDDIPYYFIDVEEKQGKLVTLKTRDQTAYNFLPAYSLGSCFYIADTIIMVDEQDAAILDINTQNIIDTMHSQTNPSIYVLKDTFYIEANPNYYNITVDFLIKNGDSYDVFDWGTCSSAYNARFPVLSDKDKSPLEGVLRYSLKSSGFRIMFSTKTLKLRIQIKDRLLHSSNIIETPDFTLDKIRR